MNSSVAITYPAVAIPPQVAALEESAHNAARMLKLLANEQRLILLCKLMDGECSVGELSDYVQLAQSATSQHLARLRREGLVSTRRDAQTIHYSLSDPDAIRILTTLCDVFGGAQHPMGG